MTKETVIDGVDVSECEHNAGKLCSMSLEACCYCSAKPNCIYKRFKRKEQECEELKQRLHQCWTVENSFVEQLDQLEAKLKQEKALKEVYFTCYKAKHEDIKGEFFKLKQTLAEIKDFVENEMIPNGDTHIILQKISEVEDDR